MIYLYLKIHNKTGLQYLGKTIEERLKMSLSRKGRTPWNKGVTGYKKRSVVSL